MNYWMNIIDEKLQISEEITKLLNDRFSDSDDSYSSLIYQIRRTIDMLLSNKDRSHFFLTGTSSDYDLIVVRSFSRYQIKFELF